MTAYDASTATWINYDETDATGAYAINLPAGSYKLLIQTNTAGYPDTWYGGTTFANATTVVVDGAETVNITVTGSTSVSGTVSKSGGAGPLVGSYVTAYDASTATWTNYDETDATGAYAINLPAGSYKLLIQTNTAGYPDTWYGGTTFANATTVVVDGAETVNITVTGSTSVSGTVSKSGGAGPLVGSYVTAYDASTATWTNYDETDATGAYAINLPAGSYKLLIQTNTAGYPDTWYGGTTFANATTVVVDGAETVNITVTGSTSVSGTVSKSGGAGPLVGSYVTAYDASTATWTNYDETDATGAYAINLPAGSYKLLIQTNTAGYPDTWYGGTTFANATTVVVDGAETVNITVTGTASTLRGWWTMDGNANDSSGQANHASLIGSPTFVAGQVGQALSLNGTSQNASVPDAASLDLTTGMTLAAWIRPGVTVNTTQDVIKKATNAGINGYELSLSSAGKVFVRLNQVTSGDTFRINSATNYPLNNTAWMHVAATYDGTTIKLYINGVQESGDLAGPAAIATNNLAVGLGAQSDNTRRFTGLLDDARIYGSALSASQVAALAGIPNAPTLNSPADGATGVGTSPTLSVGVSDPDANPLTVTFFGRPFASGNFTQIAQNTGVASGTNTTTSWANIGAGQKFEWYATVSDGTATSTGPTWTFNTAAGADPVFVGAGDIASCDVTTDTDTGVLLEGIQGHVWTTGDNVYDFGTTQEFADCYAPTPWGGPAIKPRTRPVPGNHDWGTGGPREDLVPYFAYFGANATDTGGKSYYSYDIAGSNWHVVNLDSECQLVPGGCGEGSAQDLWLEADLAANSTDNVIAVWHKPRYSSGATNNQNMQALWDDLYAAGVDILLDGHDHIYERTVPMKSGATLSSPPVADPTFGIRQFTVGTGGEAHHGLATPLPTSVVRNDETFGIMKLTLHATSYDWVFLPIAGSSFTDSGTGSVHGAPPPSSPSGWWTMDGNANDSSGQANHASLIGSPTFVAGQVGQALSLNGTSQNASVPDAASLDLTTGMTLAAWIRPGVTVNTTQDVIKKATNAGINGYELSLSSAGKVFVRLNQVTSGDTFRINSATNYPLNNTAWMHVAATYDGTTIKLYINGVQESGDLAGPAAIATNNLAVGLGAQSDNTRRFTGLLDDARIYGSALSASQVAALANVGGGNTAPVAGADSYSTPQDTQLVQTAPGVLSNDTDANSDPLTAVLNVNVIHGTLALNANGGFTYTPTTGYSGPDNFTYHANDGTANSNIVTVSLTVTASAATQPLDALAASASTSDKPQSKLWQHDGAWWMVAPRTTPAPAGTWIWKLIGVGWSPVIQLSAATDTHADVRAVGNVTHILLYGASPQLYSVQYNTSADTYEPWASRTTGTSITLTGSETATIDVDSTGRMWLATENGANLNVFYSDSPYTSFSGPVTLANNINGDDIGVVTALPNNTIGVLWSNQTTKRFGFKVHVDGASPTAWSADELPASQSADDSLPAANGMADDHLNVKVAADGTLYAAVKTSYDTAGYTKIALIVRRPNGDVG